MSFSNYFMADSAALESAVAQLLLTTAGSHSADAAAASQQLASWAQQPRFNISLMVQIPSTIWLL